MARTSTAPDSATGHDLDGLADVVQVLTDTVRVLARLIVVQSEGPGAATFAQIANYQLHVATEPEAQRLVNWLETHP